MNSRLCFIPTLLLATIFSSAVIAQEKPEAPAPSPAPPASTSDRDRARALFPVIKASLAADDDKWEKPFEEFLTLNTEVQGVLAGWLLTRHRDQMRLVRIEEGGLKTGGGLSTEDKAQQKKDRAAMEETRTQAEPAMKETLKTSGWTTLERLIKLAKKGGGTASPEAIAKLEVPLRQAELAGTLLNRMADARGKDHPADLDDIRKIEKAISEQKEAVTSAGPIVKVLAENAAMSKIPAEIRAGVLELNIWRIAQGYPPLVIDPKLCEASVDHAKDMEKLGFFAHESPVEGKKQPWDRAKNFGTKASGENIAINDSVAKANKAWFYSPGHHVNMFRPKFTVIGLGASGRHYVQMFR